MSTSTTYNSTAPDWENPHVFGKNKRSPHVPYLSHASLSDALACRTGFTFDLSRTRRTLLDSEEWKIKMFEGPHTVAEDFWKNDFDDSEWSTVAVPSNVECTGHGTPIYTNIVYPFPLDPPNVPEDNPTACYRYQFEVPENLIDTEGRIFLVFDGISSAGYVWLNENFVGYTQGSMTPAEFEVTSMLTSTSALLAVEVLRWSDGSYLEDQDQWRLSGIFRDVYLVYKAQSYLEDYSWMTPLTYSTDGELESGKFKVEAKIQTEGASNLQFRVQLFNYGADDPAAPLYDQTEDAMMTETTRVMLDNTGVKNRQSMGKYISVEVDVKADINSIVKLWSAENPHVYLLVVSLESNGSIIDCESSIVGFRCAEIVNQQLLHNGKALRICGANLHEHDQWKGKAISEELMVQDIKLMKQRNFNGVRCSHYPHHYRLYELCSLFGMYVVDETNFETHGFDESVTNNEAHPGSCLQWMSAIVDRGIRMFETDKNHPSILMWSIGNEAGYGAAHAMISAYFHHRDKTRVVHYEGGGSDTPSTDVLCPMYSRIERIIEMVNVPGEHRPLILCEYAHSMGNSTGNFQEYWDAIDAHPSLQGGFIWDWVDQGLMFQTENGEYHWGYGGDFGDTPNDAQFCLNGLVSPDRAILHPAIYECAFVHAEIKFNLRLEDNGNITVEIKNMFSFISDEGFTYEYRFKGSTSSSLDWTEFSKDVLQPGESTSVVLGNLSEMQDTITEVVYIQTRAKLTNEASWADAGHVINVNQLRFSEETLLQYGWTRSETTEPPAESTPSVIEEDERFVVQYPDYTMHIEKSSGCISSITLDSAEMLKSAIIPCFYRAPTDNDLGGESASYATHWAMAGLDRLVIKTAEVTYHPATADESGSIHNVIHIGPSDSDPLDLSTIVVDVNYNLNAELEVVWSFDTSNSMEGIPELHRTLPRVGIRFSLDPDYSQLSWIGCGPFECYPDRKKAAFPDNHRVDSVAELHFPYIFPTESGGRADVDSVEFNNANTSSLILKSTENSFQLNASIYPMESFIAAKHDFELESNGETNVHIDSTILGVGGDDSWSPSVHTEYQVPPGIYHLKLGFKLNKP